MADHIDQVNVNMLSANTFSVKKEQCEEDNFIEDKVYISETAITIDNAVLQGPIRYDKVKQYEESTCFDNIKDIKTESLAFEMIDNVKVEEGITADDIKIDLNNGLLYCEDCEVYYEFYCIKCGMLVHILNKNTLDSADNGARVDIPNDILKIQDCFGQIGIYALRTIPAGVKFGPFTGLSTTESPWEMKEEKFVLDESKSKYLNWMQYVNPTRNICDKNLHVVQSEDNIYYQSTHLIQAGDELLVYFSKEYKNSPKKIVILDFVTTMKDIVRDVFACTFCCLGFSSKSHLAKHKTICVGDAAGHFPIEELAQCPFCKIHLDPKEYSEHHMAFCCERNARKGVLPTPPAKLATTALNGRKRCPRQIYKCEQCKYRTKYHADLKNHTKQHYEVKMYKCGICNRRFKTKESLRLHVENVHAYVGGKGDQEHSTTNYSKTRIKVEQLSSQHQKKIFKCSLCVFRAKYKQSIRRHIKDIHLKIFNFKCEECEFRTSHKYLLKEHIKTKHLKEFDFKCEQCEFRTSRKYLLKGHIKTKHLKQFDYKCDLCEFGTNDKQHLEYHIKSKHLKEFNYSCDSCEFRTIKKTDLTRHMKTKHLKEFNYRCDSCEFRTIKKTDLTRHIKTIHLKEFDYKCNSCEYKTNSKKYLEGHTKTKHLKKFDHKCEKCEFRTNNKQHLKYHMKSKHLKEFNYRCDSCEYKTNSKQNLEGHIKTKHLKQFDYKCDNCQFGTNSKQHFKLHIKTKHLKEFNYNCNSCGYKTNHTNNLKLHIKDKHSTEFDFKCESCEFRTRSKYLLEEHVKTKHLKKFDHKCDLCEYRTNRKGNLAGHMKRKHL